MKIELRCEGYSAPDRLRSHVHRRLGRALERFRDRVQWARVRLTDVNGPRGGSDMHCLVQLRVRGASDIILQDRQADALSAFDRAAGRVIQALMRQIDRRRRPQRGRILMEPTPA